MAGKQTAPKRSRARPPPIQTPPSRKRQIDTDTDTDTDHKPQPKGARLTRKNLALFNKIGKKSSTHRESTSESQETLSSTAPGFALQVSKNGILPPFRSKPPTNFEVFQERRAQSRATASPPEARRRRLCPELQLIFTGLPEGLGFNDGLSAPQPDYVEGLEEGEFEPFPVREIIDGAVLYENDPYSLSSYFGAALVYARNKALAYIGMSDPPGAAAVTTDGTILDQFAHYAEKTKDGKTKYHQYRIKSTNLIISHESFEEGRRSLRNAQDFARDQSYAPRDDLREHYQQHQPSTLPSVEGTTQAILSVPDSQPPMFENTTPRVLTPTRRTPKRRRCMRKKSTTSKSGRYYHKHSDGTISWYAGEEDEYDYYGLWDIDLGGGETCYNPSL
ncbi:hypothetical protein B0T16DRAFT_450910 [Cercophora newfieldiana]|uniref:Uncharacterized protein n=1 Tax=Cercophora newfieldiana TaxID=92897 RepID=A0AA40CZQ4_9PEZI|nr:hypothetical protein B0T16DRAFT_450910 [Cercophora newfieldiana]